MFDRIIKTQKPRDTAESVLRPLCASRQKNELRPEPGHLAPDRVAFCPALIVWVQHQVSVEYLAEILQLRKRTAERGRGRG